MATSEASIDGLVARLAAAGPAYRKKVERTLHNLQAVLKGPKPLRRLAGDRAKAEAAERALRLELALLDGIRDGQVKLVQGPDGRKVWWLDQVVVQRWFSVKELA